MASTLSSSMADRSATCLFIMMTAAHLPCTQSAISQASDNILSDIEHIPSTSTS